MSNPVLGRGFRTQEPIPVPVDSQYGYPQQSAYPQMQQGTQYGYREPVMTFDDVVTKTGIALGAMMLVAALTFVLMPIGPATMLVTGGAAIVGLVLAIVVAFRKTVTPGLALAYAVIEGVFVGGISKAYESMFAGIVPQAVFATFVTAGVTLAVMKYGKIKVGQKFRTGVMIATFAYAGVMLLNFGLSLAGINLGMFGRGADGATGLAMAVAGIAVLLAVMNLVVDFDDIRVGIESGAPASESWRAAFGLTVTMVWLYISLLRILSYFRD